MTKYVNFEDTVFILNMRIGMIRDMLRLEASPELFLYKTLDDLEFINSMLEFLAASLAGESRSPGRKEEFDNLADIEWQFSQLLTEMTGTGSPFPAEEFPQIREKVLLLRETIAARELLIHETGVPVEQARTESQVSSAELSELLQGF
jgi:hypothetical protein